MVREYAPRANALSLTSAPAFSTDGSFDVGVWNGHKYDTLEGYMATDRSATVTIYQTDVSGRWDWSKTIYGNNAGSSVVVVDVAASLKADLVRIVIQGTSGDTPTQSGFRLVTKGKIAGQDDVNISGQAVKTWMSGAVTVLNSGPVPVNMSGQVIKVWESGAVTVLASGPVPINPGVYAFNISGAPTVLVSGPLVVKISGETINIAAVSISNVTVEISGDPVQVGNFPDATSGGPRSLRVEASGELVVRFSGEVVKVWESGAVTVLQSGAVTTLVSGPLPVNMSGQEIKVWQSGAVTVLQSGAITVLTSGPVPVNISGQEIKTWVSGAVTVLQSGAVTVLVSGPLVVKTSGEQVQSLPPEVVKVWHPFGQGQLTSGGDQYGTELSGAASTYTVVQAATINNPTGYVMEEIEAGLTLAVKSTGSGYPVLFKWQASDDGNNWQDLCAAQTRAADASAYADRSVAGRIMFSGNFLGTGATFQVRSVVAISDTSSGELAYGKNKNSTYLLARYRRL